MQTQNENARKQLKQIAEHLKNRVYTIKLSIITKNGIEVKTFNSLKRLGLFFINELEPKGAGFNVNSVSNPCSTRYVRTDKNNNLEYWIRRGKWNEIDATTSY